MQAMHRFNVATTVGVARAVGDLVTRLPAVVADDGRLRAVGRIRHALRVFGRDVETGAETENIH